MNAKFPNLLIFSKICMPQKYSALSVFIVGDNADLRARRAINVRHSTLELPPKLNFDSYFDFLTSTTPT